MTKAVDGAVTREDVEHIARLARLALDTGEIDALTVDMNAILAYVETLRTVDVSAVEAALRGADAEPTPTRSDLVRDSLPLDAALRAAPVDDGRGFIVPKVIEGQ